MVLPVNNSVSRDLTVGFAIRFLMARNDLPYSVSFEGSDLSLCKTFHSVTFSTLFRYGLITQDNTGVLFYNTSKQTENRKRNIEE